MDMLYYIYIGNDRSTINHLSKVTGGMFMAVSSSNKAAKVICRMLSSSAWGGRVLLTPA